MCSFGVIVICELASEESQLVLSLCVYSDELFS
jgi:hypothetical protein